MTSKARLLIALILGVVTASIAAKSLLIPPSSPTHRSAARPALPSAPDEAPAEVREFLDRVMQKLPEAGRGAAGYQFHDWEWDKKPTHEAVGLKAVAGIDPERFLACVMDVDHYADNISYVETSRSIADPEYAPPSKVRFFQKIRVPRVAMVQQELVLVDAGTIKGYRVAYWYLLKDKPLDPKSAARSEFNVGAWVVAPGTVGYALSSWPRREDVNGIQWISLTSGANALARSIVEGNIDGMAKWSRR